SVIIDVRVRWADGTVQAIPYREVYRFNYGVTQGNQAPQPQNVINDWNAAQSQFVFTDHYTPSSGRIISMLTSEQVELQTEYFNNLIGQFGLAGGISTQVAMLESSRALFDAYLTIGLPETYEASDAMRSILRGGELGLGTAGLVYFLQSQIDAIRATGIPLTAAP